MRATGVGARTRPLNEFRRWDLCSVGISLGLFQSHLHMARRRWNTEKSSVALGNDSRKACLSRVESSVMTTRGPSGWPKNLSGGKTVCSNCMAAEKVAWEAEVVINAPNGKLPAEEWVRSRNRWWFKRVQFPGESTNITSPLSRNRAWTLFMSGVHRAITSWLAEVLHMPAQTSPCSLL